MNTKADVVHAYREFTFGNRPGLGTWLSEQINPQVLERIIKLEGEPITKVQLNQLLVLSRLGSVSDGFFKYYWCDCPEHTYDVRALPLYNQNESELGTEIRSHDHFRWGLYRLYVDGLLYFGNVNAAFNFLRSLNHDEVIAFFAAKRFDTKAISDRGPALPLVPIARDDRYLISEMACKTFGEVQAGDIGVREKLRNSFRRHLAKGGSNITIKELLSDASDSQTAPQLQLSFDDVLEDSIANEDELDQRIDRLLREFNQAREKAARNTELYLSMVNDLDVYVATSMRSRENFRQMADACERIFHSPKLEQLHLRYFDPTLSAAQGHEDKGLIECLMVKCSKVLVYCEGEKESYGKDAEAAMALSLGKPVIFYCDHGKRTSFYRDVHPLARLIDFRSGVAVGAIVSDDVEEVAELLLRIFKNRMQYRIEHHPQRPGYLKLVECLTASVVRLQTADELITATFWNNYHNRKTSEYISLAAGKESERLME